MRRWTKILALQKLWVMWQKNKRIALGKEWIERLRQTNECGKEGYYMFDKKTKKNECKTSVVSHNSEGSEPSEEKKLLSINRGSNSFKEGIIPWEAAAGFWLGSVTGNGSSANSRNSRMFGLTVVSLLILCRVSQVKREARLMPLVPMPLRPLFLDPPPPTLLFALPLGAVLGEDQPGPSCWRPAPLPNRPPPLPTGVSSWMLCDS